MAISEDIQAPMTREKPMTAIHATITKHHRIEKFLSFAAEIICNTQHVGQWAGVWKGVDVTSTMQAKNASIADPTHGSKGKLPTEPRYTGTRHPTDKTYKIGIASRHPVRSATESHTMPTQRRSTFVAADTRMTFWRLSRVGCEMI